MKKSIENYLVGCVEGIQNDQHFADFYTKGLCIIKASIVNGDISDKDAETWRSRLDKALQLRKVRDGKKA